MLAANLCTKMSYAIHEKCLNFPEMAHPNKKSAVTRAKALLKKVPGLVPLVRMHRLLINPRYRSEWLLQQRKPKNLFQPFSTTAFDRHPKIFSFVAERLSDVPSPRILSFGCSTGEEAFTLRKYFPDAEIVGIDINPRNIAICKKKLRKSGDGKIRFELASSSDFEPAEHYDAVFCMSVLRHGGLGTTRPENCSHLIRFEDFERSIAGLCRIVKHGGFFVIRWSNFRFADTDSAPGFTTVYATAEALRADMPIYGPDNRLLPGVACNEVVFRKRACPESASI